jgi:hypothetical protein
MLRLIDFTTLSAPSGIWDSQALEELKEQFHEDREPTYVFRSCKATVRSVNFHRVAQGIMPNRGPPTSSVIK